VPGVHVDRAACAWLIRRFIDPGQNSSSLPTSRRPADVTPFDMRGAALGTTRPVLVETALGLLRLADDPALERSPTSSTKPTYPTSVTTHPPPQASTCSSRPDPDQRLDTTPSPSPTRYSTACTKHTAAS